MDRAEPGDLTQQATGTLANMCYHTTTLAAPMALCRRSIFCGGDPGKLRELRLAAGNRVTRGRGSRRPPRPLLGRASIGRTESNGRISLMPHQSILGMQTRTSASRPIPASPLRRFPPSPPFPHHAPLRLAVRDSQPAPTSPAPHPSSSAPRPPQACWVVSPTQITCKAPAQASGQGGCDRHKPQAARAPTRQQMTSLISRCHPSPPLLPATVLPPPAQP